MGSPAVAICLFLLIAFVLIQAHQDKRRGR